MNFTGRTLQIVRNALDLAHQELHNMIATCPDVVEYAEDIEEYERQQKELEKLMERIDRRLMK